MRYISIAFLLVVVAACGTAVPFNAPGPNAIAGATEDARQMTQQAYANQDRAAQQTRAAESAIAQQTAQSQALQATADSQRSTVAADEAVSAALRANAVATQVAANVQITQMFDYATATAGVATRAAAVELQATARAMDEADKDADRRETLANVLSVGVGILLFVVTAILTVAFGWLLIGIAKAMAERAQARASQEQAKADQERAKADQERARARRDEVLEYDSILFNLTTKQVMYQARQLPAPRAEVVQADVLPSAPEIYRPRGLDETEDDPDEPRAVALKDRLETFLRLAAGVYAQEGKRAGKADGRDKDGNDVWDARQIPSAAKMLKEWGYGNDAWQLRKNFFARYDWLEASPTGTVITRGRTLRDMIQWVSGLDETFLEAYLQEKETTQKAIIIDLPVLAPSPTGA